MRAAIAVRPDIHHEGAGRDFHLIGPQQEHHIERAGSRHLLRVAAAGGGHEADVERADA